MKVLGAGLLLARFVPERVLLATLEAGAAMRTLATLATSFEESAAFPPGGS